MKANSKFMLGLAALGLLVVVLIAFYFLKEKNEEAIKNEIPPIELSEEVRVAIDPREGKERVSMDQNSTQNLSFRILDDSSRNPQIGVYVNDEKVSELNALEVYNLMFSPNNAKASFQTSAVCGAECLDFETYIVDMESLSLERMSPPRTDDFPGEKRVGEDVEYEIHTTEWTDDSNMNVTGFYVAQGAEGYLRVSQEEIWNYNLESQLYSLSGGSE